MPNCNFQDYFSIRKLVDGNKTLSNQEDAADKFATHSVIGNIQIGGAFSIDFIPIYKNHRYKLFGVVVPRDTGVFVLRGQNFNFGHRIPQLDLGKDKDGHQLLATFGFTSYLINNGNTHYNIFLQHCKHDSSQDNFNPVLWTEDKFAYTFVVK